MNLKFLAKLLSILLFWDLFQKMGYERLRQKRFFNHLLRRQQLHQTKTLWLFIINTFMLRTEMQFINGQLTISHAVFALLSIDFFVLIVDALKAFLLTFFLLFLWEATRWSIEHRFIPKKVNIVRSYYFLMPNASQFNWKLLFTGVAK